MTFYDIFRYRKWISIAFLSQHAPTTCKQYIHVCWPDALEIGVRRHTNQWWRFLSPWTIFSGMRFWVLPLRPPPCVHYAAVPWFFLVVPPPCIQQPEVWFSNLSLHTQGSGRTSQHWQWCWWCDDIISGWVDQREIPFVWADYNMNLRNGEELVLCISWQTGYTRFGFLLLGSYVDKNVVFFRQQVQSLSCSQVTCTSKQSTLQL